MSLRTPTNEFRRWASLDADQKSYTIQVLHWFHYRPKAVGQSWVREEVLTWELVRALDLLPRSLFLEPLLLEIATFGGQIEPVARALAKDAEAVVVEPFPSLGLKGAKRNRRSDIGLVAPSGATLWLEAKTAPVKPAILLSQLKDQTNALQAQCDGRPCAVAALLPDRQPHPPWPTLRWGRIGSILDRCGDALRAGNESDSLLRGLRVLAHELQARIRTHPARLAAYYNPR